MCLIVTFGMYLIFKVVLLTLIFCWFDKNNLSLHP